MADDDITLPIGIDVDPALANTIQFCIADREVLRIEPDGRFFVGEREVKGDEQVRDLFASWVRHVMGTG